MAGLIIVLVILGGTYHLGRYRGIELERHRHSRAVREATDTITSMSEWRGR